MDFPLQHGKLVEVSKVYTGPLEVRSTTKNISVFPDNLRNRWACRLVEFDGFLNVKPITTSERIDTLFAAGLSTMLVAVNRGTHCILVPGENLIFLDDFGEDAISASSGTEASTLF